MAVVDDAGLLTGVGGGDAEVAATTSGATGTARIVVLVPLPATVAVTPDSTGFQAFGDTLRLTAEVRDQFARLMLGEVVEWKSSDLQVASVDSAGLVTAAGNGTATITATAGSASGSATVTVAQRVESVEITPSADTLFLGDTVRLAAAARDANGHAVAGVEFSWSSSDTAVAVVDDTGLLTGVGGGEAEVAAAASEVTGTARMVVIVPVPATVAVTPDSTVFRAFGDTLRLTAEVRDQFARLVLGEVVEWTSSDLQVASVDSAGLVTAAGNGTATITATAGSASGSATVTVAQRVQTVEITPSADTLFLGDTVRLAAAAPGCERPRGRGRRVLVVVERHCGGGRRRHGIAHRCRGRRGGGCGRRVRGDGYGADRGDRARADDGGGHSGLPEAGGSR